MTGASAMVKRRICYVTGTRADFGLMQSTLQIIHSHPDLHLDIIVTGTHLADQYGKTVREIEDAGLSAACRVPVDLGETSGAAMARNIGQMLSGMVGALESIRPDIMLILGDRGEMLAAALAAIHLNIVVAHIHGGERSGTVDEPVRHAISKLSHLHLVATQEAKDRLTRMGENPRNIHLTGAPGLDGLLEAASIGREELCRKAGLNATGSLALFIYHPVLQEAERGGHQTAAILQALLMAQVQIVALAPNSDAGREQVQGELLKHRDHPKMKMFAHLPRHEFASWMAACDVMIGNSSSGIIEAATFGTPVINVGSRQNLRERNDNTVDVAPEPEAVAGAVASALRKGRYEPANRYGDGHAGERICRLLAQSELSHDLLHKSNSY